MSLSKYLQSILLPCIKELSPDELKIKILQSGEKWFYDNPQEILLVENNFRQLGVSITSELLESTRENILLHYYEKMLPLTGKPQDYHLFLEKHIDGADALKKIEDAYNSGRGILLATAHFGAVEFIAPYLSTAKLPVNVLLRFTTEKMSQSINEIAEQYYKSGLFSLTRFIEIGKPKTNAALDMAAVLRRNELLLAVFDEKTDYSIPVSLYNCKLWGGAGLHKLIAFTQRDITLFTTFMVRLKENRYKLVLTEIDKSNDNGVQMFYDSLSDLLNNYLEQWYFVHEELPFVDSCVSY